MVNVLDLAAFELIVDAEREVGDEGVGLQQMGVLGESFEVAVDERDAVLDG